MPAGPGVRGRSGESARKFVACGFRPAGIGLARTSPGASEAREEDFAVRRPLAVSIFFIFCGGLAAGCSAPITKREQGGLIGAGVGAGAGAIIGSTVGHAAEGRWSADRWGS
jgi:hypothetical protein